MMDATKYAPGYYPVPAGYDSWVKKDHIEKAPAWCSVDLRDGNQALVEPMVVEEKIEMFNMLVQMGFKEIEIGFPAASQIEFDFLRQLVERRLIPDDVTVQVLTQCRDHLLKRTFESIQGIPKAVVHIYNSTSTLQRDVVFHMDREEIKQIAIDGVDMVKKYMKDYDGKVILEYSPESFTGTEMDYALDICNAVQRAWGPTPDNKMIINLPGPPKEFNYVVEHSLKPYLEHYRQEQIYTKDYLVMGIGESMIDEKLTETQYKQTDVTLAMYAGEGYVRVRIATKAKTKEDAYQHMTPMRNEIETLLKGYLIPGGSIEKALKDIMVPIQFIGNIDVPTWFKPYVKEDADLVIYSKVEHVSLGDQVTIHVNNDKGFTDGMLKDYHLSMNRLTSKLQLYLYRYLKNSSPL